MVMIQADTMLLATAPATRKPAFAAPTHDAARMVCVVATGDASQSRSNRVLAKPPSLSATSTARREARVIFSLHGLTRYRVRPLPEPGGASPIILPGRQGISPERGYIEGCCQGWPCDKASTADPAHCLSWGSLCRSTGGGTARHGMSDTADLRKQTVDRKRG